MTTQPNVLFIHTDQQRADTLGCSGNGVIDTPNIDELASQGVQLTDAHCTHPLCMPARATLLTGRYPSVNGVWRNGLPLPDSEVTIAKVLADAGYETGLIGKAHFTPYRGDPDVHPESVRVGNVPAEECWDYWRNFEGPYYGFDHVRMSIHHSDDGIDGGHYGLWLAESHAEERDRFAQGHALEQSDPAVPSWKSAVPTEIHSTTWVADRTIEYVTADRSDPFFAWVGFPDPHFPFDPPKPYCHKYSPAEVPSPDDPRGDGIDWDLPRYAQYYFEEHPLASEIDPADAREIIAHYYGMIEFVDDAVGRILDALDQTGVADDTVVVFTSDHGEWLGDHGLWNKGPIHTRGITQIPWIVRWPGEIDPDTVIETPTSHIDMVPTLLDASDSTVPAGVQGTSLLPAVRDGDGSIGSPVLVEHRQERTRRGNALTEERRDEGNPIEHLRPWGDRDLHVKTLVTERYRYSHVVGSEHDYAEVIDRANDLEEVHNLWGEDTTVERELMDELIRALVVADDPLPERKYVA